MFIILSSSRQNRMKVFFVCVFVPVVQKLIFFFHYIRKKSPYILWNFLLYCIFTGMLKWNHYDVGDKEPLEPSSPAVCLAGLLSTSGSVDQARWAWHVKMWKPPWMDGLQLWYRLFLCWTALLVMWFILVSSLNLPCWAVASCYISCHCGGIVQLHHLCSFSSCSWK